jgi:sugar lactone lactonase YvrE
MNHEFQNAEVIISGLSGCCGQMDVQASSTGLYVAENSRHRVVRYEANGKLVSTWGKGDRTGVDGFSSCCNPMNVCFGKNGDVFTAESNTGRIKRFTADGKFVDYVGDIKLVPGCKNVSIAVSPDGDRVYMLDITRNHIVLMERKPAAAADTTAAAK